MKKRYVVCLDSNTDKGDKGFKEFIEAKGYGWWHRLSNNWLLTDSSGTSTAQEIRDELKKHYPSTMLLVIEIEGDNGTWSALTVNDPEKEKFAWLHKFWKG